VARFGPDRCNNTECPIYYKRKTDFNKLQKQRYVLERLEYEAEDVLAM
jgi:hypothetical protein